jgi:thioredoxin reductase (NADPH)
MCPDTVLAAQHIAAKNKNVTAEIYDLRHFEKIKKQYNVMSVPCVLINDAVVSFGKKNIEQILELIG